MFDEPGQGYWDFGPANQAARYEHIEKRKGTSDERYAAGEDRSACLAMRHTDLQLASGEQEGEHDTTWGTRRRWIGGAKVTAPQLTHHPQIASRGRGS